MINTSRLLRPKGSALLQVIAAMFVLSSGMTGALSLIIGAMRANDTQMHRLIATGLAQEGLEMMHNMRDTNWLVYSSNLRECWHFWPDTNKNFIVGDGGDVECTPESGQNNHEWKPDIGDPDNTIPKKFIVDVDLASFRWNLISEDDFGVQGDIDYTDGFRLYRKTTAEGTQFYTHNKNTQVGESVATTPYTREIGLYYIDDTDYDDTLYPTIVGGYFPEADTAADNRILIVSRVEWSNGGVDHNVTLSKIMTDYYDRHEWDS